MFRMDLALRMRQKMALSRPFSVPVNVRYLDNLISAIASSPEQAEATLAETEPNRTDRCGESTGTFFQIPLGLSEKLGVTECPVTPDVLYTGREGKKPKIDFAEHLAAAPKLTLDLLPPRSKKAVATLYRQRNWSSQKLREIYLAIGDRQRTFMCTEALSDLLRYRGEDVAADVGVSAPTVSRLLKDSVIQVGKYVFPAALALPVTDSIKQYAALEVLAGVLREESAAGFSDEALSRRAIAEGVTVARRTFAKYRGELKIPTASERTRAYREGTRFSVPLTLKDYASMSLHSVKQASDP